MDELGNVFDGVKLSRPAVSALVDAGFESLADLPDDLTELLALHGFGPSAVPRLEAARSLR